VTDPFDFLQGQQPEEPPQREQPLSRRAARAGRTGRTPTPAETDRTGLFAQFAKHPRAWLFSAIGVAFVLLGTGSLFAGIAAGGTRADAVAVPTATATTAAPRPIVSSTPTPLRTCSIAGLATAPGLGSFGGTVINTTTGEVLFDRNGSTGVATASVMKLLTSATALADLGPTYQFKTTVYAGTTPGSVILVGGGDATLSAAPAGQSVYKGAPTLADLAGQVNTAWQALNPDQPITSVVLDASMWNTSDSWDPSVPMTERTQGYQPYITALMVDGDRANPASQDSPRSTDPVARAGAAFVAALGLPADTPVSDGTAISGSKQLGQVQSQPLSTLISYMLPISDNTLAEMMARVSSKVSGRDGSAASLTATYTSALAGYGIDATGLVIRDGSGESNLDAVPPALVAKLMVQVNAGGKGLDTIYNALPVSGKTGTLATRFTGPNAVARGAVNAKTGSIATAYALAGIVHAKDGTALSFAFFAEGKLSATTSMTALDTITTGVFNCGNNLSNN
jgi:D-alanyl-D-alanine carboxypeptidase/D-alanyl-D-alanine-endopeptidase (penicillin-binding protein 4)